MELISLIVLALLSFPASAKNNAKYLKVFPGEKFTCAQNKENKYFCFGDGENGGLGNGSTLSIGSTAESMKKLKPLVFSAEDKVKTMAVGTKHACALFISGKLKCWGLNDFGELGMGVDNRTIGTLPIYKSVPALY